MKTAFLLVFLLAASTISTSVPESASGISSKQALSIAQSHVPDRKAEWKVGLTRHVPELSGEEAGQGRVSNGHAEERKIWQAEAKFESGNKEVYYIDASSGKLLSLSEIEVPSIGLRLLPAALEARLLAKPSSQESGVSASGATGVSGSLNVSLKEKEGGFRLKLAEEENTTATVMQSLVSPDNGKTVLHLVRRTSPAEGGTRYRLDLVAVQPAKKTFKVFPFADLRMSDTYSADTLAMGYGFRDDSHVVMIQPVGKADGAGIGYRIVSLDVQNGRIRELAANVPPDLSPDFLASGWLNANGSKLYLNSYRGGKLWIADLAGGGVKALDGTFSHTWPLLRLFRSPDGERFWYEKDGYRLYDGKGVQLSVLPADTGLHSNPALKWSPDSRYAAYEYTFSNSEENVIGGEDYKVIAPQGIKILGRDGKAVWSADARELNNGDRLELRGWIGGSGESLGSAPSSGSTGNAESSGTASAGSLGAAVLRSYTLERAVDREPRKTGSVYHLVQPATGKLTKLSAARLADLHHPQAVTGGSGALMLVDAGSALYTLVGDETNSERTVKLLSASEPQRLLWAETDSAKGSVTITAYDIASKKARTTETKDLSDGDLQAAGEEYVIDSGLVYQKLQ
ncbi:PepSY domain-containing protein [Paenibacillus chitinolyticus]|uniref:PepSY domain-containing protein n=1 Tax=Paenibacillus chitinolyticus TaxID=79263 RepID=UPI002DBA0F27|nr:PepSY domain-containing protein [Paenibacillus chitinolyticus]MEC0247992.1 PepSY domain-containing protein [Paenibacillus chitinolyticus]